MSFWRSLNKTLNTVGSHVAGLAANSGIPGISQAGGILGGVIQAGQSQPSFMPIGTGGYEVTVPVEKKSDNTLIFVGVVLVVVFLLKKK